MLGLGGHEAEIGAILLTTLRAALFGLVEYFCNEVTLS